MTITLTVPHLLEEILLVLLVLSPTHMENIGMNLVIEKVFHKPMSLMESESSRELLSIPRQDLNL